MQTLPPTPPDFDAKDYARAAAAAIALPIPDRDLPEVAANLERTAAFAQLLARVPGLDEEEPAPVFRPEETAG